MFNEVPISRAVRIAFGSSVVGMSLACGAAWSQVATTDTVQTGERVEVTGSSIKRINAETALPIITLSQEDIKKSGYTSATELIQSLPSNQGFLTASQSINGGGGGAATASLHSIGAKYTLVLLNGRRLAPLGTDTTVNLNELPLSAIDHIEILLDGASALYGADAIAGVVNFITKKNTTEGILAGQGTVPQRQGARSSNVSLSKGFGDLETDRFNVFGTVSFEKQNKLEAKQRDFSKTGIIPFEYNGRNVTTFQTSANTVPGSVTLNDSTGTGAGAATYSPYYYQSGACGPTTVFRAGNCRYDLASTVELIPAYRRSGFFGSGEFKLAEALTLFGEATVSDFRTQARYAAPAQPGIFVTPALYAAHVAPTLAAIGVAPGTFYPVGDPDFLGPTINLRLYDAGGRQDEYRYFSQNYVFGGRGSASIFDYSAYVSHSQNQFTDTQQSGYASSNGFNALVASGAYDPLSSTQGQSTAVLAPIVLHQKFDSDVSTLDVAHGQVSASLFKLPGGDVQLGFGGEFQRQKFSDSPSAIAQGNNAQQPYFTDTPIGGSSGALPFRSKRDSTGVFTELVAPVIQSIELTGSIRHDHYGKVTNTENFDSAGNLSSSASQGREASASTYKFGARWQPIPELLFRGSLGTGFKAPSLSDITSPVAAFGNTGFHTCPPGLPAAIAARCQPLPTEYNLRQGGNPNSDESGLSPEKSKQYTIGFRIEPSQALSFGVDLWSVKLRNRIGVVPEDVAFGDGATYAAAFAVIPDPITGAPTLTFTQAPLNLGKARYKGLDFDAGSRVDTPIGALTTKGTVTYMIKSDYEVAGLNGYQSSLGKYGVDTEVTYRYLVNLSASLASGPFTNTINFRFKPGYHDAQTSATDPTSPTIVRVINANGTYGASIPVTRDVEKYYIFDYQGRWDVNKALGISGGIRNLFNRRPPFTIQAQAGTGNFQGYDGRYTDPTGRAFYLGADVHF